MIHNSLKNFQWYKNFLRWQYTTKIRYALRLSNISFQKVKHLEKHIWQVQLQSPFGGLDELGEAIYTSISGIDGIAEVEVASMRPRYNDSGESSIVYVVALNAPLDSNSAYTPSPSYEYEDFGYYGEPAEIEMFEQV